MVGQEELLNISHPRNKGSFASGACWAMMGKSFIKTFFLDSKEENP